LQWGLIGQNYALPLRRLCCQQKVTADWIDLFYYANLRHILWNELSPLQKQTKHKPNSQFFGRKFKFAVLWDLFIKQLFTRATFISPAKRRHKLFLSTDHWCRTYWWCNYYFLIRLIKNVFLLFNLTVLSEKKKSSCWKVTQCVEVDFNKKSCSDPKTTTAWKGILYRIKITINQILRKSEMKHCEYSKEVF
jgi:hypothetical protein